MGGPNDGRADVEDLELGRAHYRQRAWADAFEALARADAGGPLALPDLELLGWAAGLSGHAPQMLAAFERLYEANLAAGQVAAAARAAIWLGFRLGSLGEVARASAWNARAQRLLASHEMDCSEHGWVKLAQFHRLFAAGEYEEASQAAAQAIAVGERCADLDLVSFGRNLQGRSQLRQGRIEQGLLLLDESMLPAVSDRLSPLVTGLVYCSAILGCRQVYALDRAREWTVAMGQWCDAQPQVLAFSGFCMAQRCEIMHLTGDWSEALAGALRTAEQFGSGHDQPAAAEACYVQGEIHRLRGEWDEAEEAYRRASQRGRDPQPGLALLRVAQGRLDAALQSMRRVLGATTEPLQRLRFLPAGVEIMLAAGEFDAARELCAELEAHAQSYRTEVLGAMASEARAELSLAENNPQGAIEPLQRALAVWQRIGAAYAAAHVLHSLSRACRALEDSDGADLASASAREICQRLGIAAEATRMPAAANAAAPRHNLTARELQVLRLVAAGKTNKRIAKELSLSEKTVDRHVSNILSKLDVHSRAAATAYAYEHQLI